MNRILKITLILIGCIISLFAIASFTNILQVYKAPSNSNYPAIKPGERFFASRIVAPKRFSLICYKWNDTLYGNHVRVHRLCGIEGDTVEIRDGELLLNRNFVDSNLTVAHPYILSSSELQKVKQLEEVNENDLPFLAEDSFIITLSDKTVTDHQLNARKKLHPKTYADPGIATKFLANWNQDHFGPVVVPKNTYFLLGDNRNGSEDSRYLGFIEKSRFVGTVIGK